LIKKKYSGENNHNRHTPISLAHKKKNKDDEDNNSYLNSKNIITEHYKRTIHLPRDIRKKKFGVLTAWTERSDIPGDYEDMPIHLPPITTEMNHVLECADAPEDYYDDEGGGENDISDSTDRIIQRAVKKFSKFDFTNGKMFKASSRICNKTEHEMLRKKYHRTKKTLSDELLKLVRINLEDENLGPRVTISRIRQALKAKLRQSMISNSNSNELVNQTKITELVNKSFKKKLHHQFWEELKHKHGVRN